MNEAKYSPTPWRVDGRYEPVGSVLDAGGFEVAELPSIAISALWHIKHPRKHWGSDPKSHIERSDEEISANARLIAAAPDLLATLKQALLDSGCDGDLCAHSWHEEARLLIAKVEEVE